jgi:hypothetical protein
VHLTDVDCGFSRKRCFVAYETHNVRLVRLLKLKDKKGFIPFSL